MYFLEYVLQNMRGRKVRTFLTALAISISIGTVVTMGILTHSLRQTAISVLQTGKADFSIAQKGVSDVIYSSMDQGDVQNFRNYPGVQSTVGVLVAPVKLDDQHPFFLQLGINPEELNDFGVQVVAGRPYSHDAPNEAMLGYRASRDLNKGIGDKLTIDENTFTIVGIYSTGQIFGDQASMMPLPTLQANERKPGTVTLAFVRVKPGTNVDALRKQIETDHPELATVRTESEFGRVDRNLELLRAANIGVSGLALAIGAVMVMNTMLLTVFERTREFGVLRAVGWSKFRVLASVMTEAFLISFLAAAIGVGLGMIAVQIMKRVPGVLGVFQPDYPASVFGRALIITFAVALVGAIYPAARAALLRPQEAIRHE